jgi:hypothetical protein
MRTIHAVTMKVAVAMTMLSLMAAGADAALREVRVAAGAKKAIVVNKQLSSARVRVQHEDIATVYYDEEYSRLRIIAKAPGTTKVIFSGQVRRFMAGRNTPLQQDRAFSQTFIIVVGPAPAPRGRARR